MTLSFHAPAAPVSTTRRIIVTTMSSDSHTWNLVFLQLLLEELGNEVINFGPCVPDETLVNGCIEYRPDLIVISTVNGHGYVDGERVIKRIRARPELRSTPVAIGGKLGVAGELDAESTRSLTRAGFDAVFQSDCDQAAFRSFVESLPGQSIRSKVAGK